MQTEEFIVAETRLSSCIHA